MQNYKRPWAALLYPDINSVRNEELCVVFL